MTAPSLTTSRHEPPRGYRAAPGGATLLAVLLVLAIIPSAAALSSPGSAAILESSISCAGLPRQARELPDPVGPSAKRSDLRALALAVGGTGPSYGAAACCPTRARIPQGSPRPQSLVNADVELSAQAPARARAGEAGLPPPVA